MCAKPVLDCAAAGQAGVSRTRASETPNCDLNAAMRRLRKTGGFTGCLADTRKTMFGDFSEAPESFMHAQVQIANARCAFAGLPARVRDRFKNDPVHLLTFLADGANQKEAIELGLIDATAVALADEAARKKASESAEAGKVSSPTA